MANAAESRRLIRAAGFRVSKPRVFEANTLYDTARGELRRKGCLLRVRETGRHGVLTYKGTPLGGKYKDREELEVCVDNPQRLREIISRLGYVPGFRYEKYRTEYRRPHESGAAMLDETPVGVYLELEGAPRWIDRAARSLGFSQSDYSTASYYDLYVDYCRKHRLKVSNMTYPTNSPRITVTA